jgi:hypothetical protein
MGGVWRPDDVVVWEVDGAMDNGRQAQSPTRQGNAWSRAPL